jgi:PAS domain S-box-containing protein
MKITKKFTIWIVAAVAVICLLSSYLYYRVKVHQEEQRLHALSSTIGLMLEQSLGSAMIARDITAVSSTLDHLKDSLQIDSVRLLNGAGIVKASTKRAEVGGRLSPAAEGCSPCHEKHMNGLFLASPRVFRWAQPVSNGPKCKQCHDPSARYNGVFIIDFSTQGFRQNVRSDFMTALRIFVPSVLFIAVLIFMLTRELIIKRINRIIEKVKSFTDGNYDERIVTEGRDEITQMEENFNEMADAIMTRDAEKNDLFDKVSVVNAQLLQEVTDRKEAEREIRDNYDRQSIIDAVLRMSLEDKPIEEFLAGALDLIISLPSLSLEARGCIFLIEDDGTMVMKAQKGLPEPLLTKCASVPLGTCLCGRAALTPQVLFAASVDESHDTTYPGMSDHGHYCVTIVFGGKILGVLTTYVAAGHKREEREEEFLKAVANVMAGIIERRRVENERRTLFNELQITFKKVSDSQKMWQQTFDSIGDLISIIDADFNIIKVNRAFADYFGIDLKDVTNKKCYDLFHAEGEPVANCPHVVTMNEDRPMTSEIVSAKPNRILAVSTFPFYFADAKFHGSIHVAKDITEEREREMRLIMSERLASLGQMASGIAHEINNPLAAIAGCAEGLHNKVRKGKFDPELFDNYLGIIEEEIVRCKNITTSMLSFVRKTSHERKVVNIGESIEKALELLDLQGRLKHIAVVKRLPSDLPTVNGNDGELRQVFTGIITNALDAMDDRGTLTVETALVVPEAQPDRREVFIRIADTGSGISPEHLSRIFNPFFTTKAERGGTGLGLSIAEKIVSNHNGRISIKTEVHKGTEFLITLPV